VNELNYYATNKRGLYPHFLVLNYANYIPSFSAAQSLKSHLNRKGAKQARLAHYIYSSKEKSKQAKTAW